MKKMKMRAKKWIFKTSKRKINKNNKIINKPNPINKKELGKEIRTRLKAITIPNITENE